MSTLFAPTSVAVAALTGDALEVTDSTADLPKRQALFPKSGGTRPFLRCQGKILLCVTRWRPAIAACPRPRECLSGNASGPIVWWHPATSLPDARNRPSPGSRSERGAPVSPRGPPGGPPRCTRAHLSRATGSGPPLHLRGGHASSAPPGSPLPRPGGRAPRRPHRPGCRRTHRPAAAVRGAASAGCGAASTRGAGGGRRPAPGRRVARSARRPRRGGGASRPARWLP